MILLMQSIKSCIKIKMKTRILKYEIFVIRWCGCICLHTAKYLLEQKDTELVVCIGRNTVKISF